MTFHWAAVNDISRVQAAFSPSVPARSNASTSFEIGSALFSSLQ